MPDKFDPYREALVMETKTIWPNDVEPSDPAKRRDIASQLHSHPEQATQLTYVRTHTGFCREITVTPADVTRLSR
jgi:hypothetical protein